MIGPKFGTVSRPDLTAAAREPAFRFNIIDTDYDEESFCVRHAYFLGARDAYKSLKASLKAEIDEEPSESFRRARLRPFARPWTRRITVKVIDHLGGEAMKVFRVFVTGDDFTFRDWCHA